MILSTILKLCESKLNPGKGQKYDLINPFVFSPILKDRGGQSVNDFLLHEKPSFSLGDQVDSAAPSPGGINSANLVSLVY